LNHPHKRRVELRDLYIYPSLRRHQSDAENQLVESHQCLEFFQNSEKLLVVADELAGKTELSKMLTQDLLQGGSSVPLLLKGQAIDQFRESGIRSILRTSIAEQFGQDSVERFLQLPKAERILIVDDWDKVPFGAKGQATAMRALCAYFSRVICLVHSLYPLERFADRSPLREAFAEFESCSINPFGRRLIGQLTETWHSLGREYTVDVYAFERDVTRSEALIHSAVEKEMLPTYP
jgi:hypothetical protein